MKTKFLLSIIALIFIVSIINVNAESVIFPDSKLKITLKSYNPDPVKPGEYFDLYLRVQLPYKSYMDYGFNNLKIEFLENYPFSLDPSESAIKDIGRLEESETADIRYTIRVDENAVEGTNYLKFKYTSREGGGTLQYTGLPIRIQSRHANIALSQITTTPERISPGSIAKLNLQLKNTADSLMHDISVKLDLSGSSIPFTPVSSTTEQKIKQLRPREETTLTFNIIADADAESKAYKIPLHLKYYDELNEFYHKNDTMGLLIDSTPEYTINLEESNVYKKGQTDKIVLSISNIGPTELKFVTLEILKDENYEIISKTKEYLGNLEADDYETAEFKIHSKKSKELPLRVLVSFKNSYNEDFNKVVTINIPMYSTAQAITYGLVKEKTGFINIIIIIIVLIFLYQWFKAWRREKDLGKGFKVTFRRWFVKAVKTVRWISKKENIKQIPKYLKKYSKEE